MWRLTRSRSTCSTSPPSRCRFSWAGSRGGTARSGRWRSAGMVAFWLLRCSGTPSDGSIWTCGTSIVRNILSQRFTPPTHTSPPWRSATTDARCTPPATTTCVSSMWRRGRGARQAHRPAAGAAAAAVPRPGMDAAGSRQPGRQAHSLVEADTEVALLDPVTLRTKARLRGRRADHQHRLLRGQQTSRDRRRWGGRLGPRREGADPRVRLPGRRRPPPDAGVPRTDLGREPHGTEPGREHRLRDREGWSAPGLGPHRRPGVPHHPMPGPACPTTPWPSRSPPTAARVAYLANVDARVDVRDVESGRLVQGRAPGAEQRLRRVHDLAPRRPAVIGAAGDAAVQLIDPGTGELIPEAGFRRGRARRPSTATDGKVVIGTIHGHVQVLDAHSLDMKTAPVAADHRRPGRQPRPGPRRARGRHRVEPTSGSCSTTAADTD